jgi:hypothetical protein
MNLLQEQLNASKSMVETLQSSSSDKETIEKLSDELADAKIDLEDQLKQMDSLRTELEVDKKKVSPYLLPFLSLSLSLSLFDLLSLCSRTFALLLNREPMN